MEISYALDRAAQNYSRSEAIFDIGRGAHLTYQQLNERVNRLGNALTGLGVRHGDRVAQLQLNSYQVIETLFAVSRIGAVKVPINSRLSSVDVKHILNDSGAKALVFDAEFQDVAFECQSEVDTLETLICTTQAPGPALNYEHLVKSGHPTRPRMEVSGAALGRLAYTGGTTGRPKGVMATQDQLAAVATNILLDHAPIEASDSLLHVQPLSHGGGAYIVPAVFRGARQVILPRFDADEVLRVCREEGITFLKLVPTMYVRMLANPAFTQSLQNVRIVAYGAAPMPTTPLIEGIERIGAKFAQTYGQTEAPSTICTLRTQDVARAVTEGAYDRLASVGRPYTTTEVRLVDDAGTDVPVDQRGEIIARGPIVMAGYWNNHKATMARKVNGWIHTGDIGKMDEAGYVYLVDRKSDMIITGGFNVYPREVEDVLYGHPGVREVAVVGVPDSDWGEVVTAVVALAPGASVSADELLAHARERLSPYKRPKRIEIRDTLPLTAVGKIARREVRETLKADSTA